jgi:hypothetical protein
MRHQAAGGVFMKKPTIVLAVLVVLLAGFTVREYVLAPDNFVNQIKSRRAFHDTETKLSAMYRANGEKGIEQQCAEPIETAGYWFTCYPSYHFSYKTWLPKDKEAFFVVDAGLFRWKSRVEAEEIAMFWKSSSRHSTIYRVSGEGSNPAYYLNGDGWADAHFITLEERQARPEDLKREGRERGESFP